MSLLLFLNIAGLQEVLDTIPNEEDLLNQNHLNELQSAIQQKADKEHEHNQDANAVHIHEQYSEIGKVYFQIR